MPVVSYEGGKLDKDKKEELVKGFTEVAARVTGIPKEAFYVYIKEYPNDSIGVGGLLLPDYLAKRRESQ
ncbi:MAG: 4-oxalocrotonate tautomerase DmpI [Candidatus Wukongarchaeota archaeon]|jgi:4-oxalocrotonate tautomerase|nr:4-oxalocrotonate tautomerase DmpI [Candidatus Wukongarchaeota archaeon]MDO8129889.1 4-oxalocrotonate tautomerase DmpI [Candidatus Wukongarchaeota archaeon]